MRWPFRLYGVLLLLVLLSVLGSYVAAVRQGGVANWQASIVEHTRVLVTAVTRHSSVSIGVAAVLAVLLGLTFALRAGARHTERLSLQLQTDAAARVALAGRVASALAEAVAELPPTVIAPEGLPLPSTLIGREHELAELRDALRSGEIVSVVAGQRAPGVGVSAVAACAVADLARDTDAFPGGAVWISCAGLAGIDGLAALWARVARGLGLHEIAATPHDEARRAALHNALCDETCPRVLLALDDVGQSLYIGALLDTLADGRATLLITAREPVAAELMRMLVIAPLNAEDGAALLAQQLQRVDGERPHPADVSDAPALSGQLDGLPLALGLAARHAGLDRLTLADLSAALHEDTTDADPSTRVQALLNLVTGTLTLEQRRLFAGLSLLASAPIPRELALTLAVAASRGGSVADVVRAAATDKDARTAASADLAVLLALSLVEPIASDRLRLHTAVRQYAAQHFRGLPHGVAFRLGDVAVAYWREYVRAHAGYDGVDAIDSETAGLMAALGWAQDYQRWRSLLALTYGVSLAWNVRGRYDEQRRLLPWALEGARQVGTPNDLRFITHALATLDAQAGELTRARAGFEEALRLGRELGDTASEADDLRLLGVLDRFEGNLARAHSELEEALNLAREAGDPLILARTLNSLGWLARDESDAAHACEYLSEALSLFEQVGSPEANEARAVLGELGCAS